jgi:GTP-binding protein
VSGTAPARKSAAAPRATPAAKKDAAAPRAAPKKAASTRDATGDPWEIVHAEFVAAAGPGSTLPDHGPEVAFAGRSNVGKSSLINTLTGRRNLVRTGATPGVTRTLTQFAARTRAGQSFALVDLPGYGFAQRSKAERQQWAQLIERYLERRPQLAVVVLLVDPRRGVEEDDRALVEFVTAAGERRAHAERAAAPGERADTPAEHAGAPGERAGAPGERAGVPGERAGAPAILVAATKIDKLGRSAVQAALRGVRQSIADAPDVPEGLPVVGWSSVTGEGKSELGRRISLALERAGARR